MKTWRDESDVVATAASRDGHGVGWVNLRFVHPEQARWLWMWCRHAAKFRPPVDVLYVHELPAWIAGKRQKATDAE